MSFLKLLCSESDAGSRIDVVLTRLLNAPRNQVQHLIEKGEVTLNGKPVLKARTSVKFEDEIQVPEDWNTERLPEAKGQPLDILYEDTDILVINKPAGQIVHPTRPEEEGSVVSAALAYDPSIGTAVYDPTSQISLLRPGIVHRLDKDTSGVLLLAKTRESMEALSTQFHAHTVTKTYLALLLGKVEEQEIRTSMRRIKHGSMTRMQAREAGEEGREAFSMLVPEQYFMHDEKELTLARFNILTGRTHQIRAQARYISHPIIGDELYGTSAARNVSAALGAKRQLLHAWQLTFQHPTTEKVMTATAPLPEDLITILTKLQPA